MEGLRHEEYFECSVSELIPSNSATCEKKINTIITS
jgi:hypothetical protein